MGARIHRIMQEARGRHSRGLLSAGELTRMGERANRLASRIRLLKGRRPGTHDHESQALRQLRTLAAVLAEAGTAVAIDVGYSRHCRFDEVGIATWRDGSVETVTLVDENALYRIPDDARRVMRHPLQVYRPSLFGPTLTLPQAEILDRVRTALEAADVAVFQSAHVDLDRLGMEVSADRIVDTAQCGQAWYRRRTPSLEELCHRFGIDATLAHNSGNDARRTLDVAIAMVADPLHGRLAAQEALRSTRDEACRRMAMLPTRAPGYPALREAWTVALLADERHASETNAILSQPDRNLARDVHRYLRERSTRAAMSARQAREVE